MQLHELKRNTPHKKPKRVGRGGKRGKTSGRGHKGQKARAGHRMRPEVRDIIKKIPKRRGHGKHRSASVNPNRPPIAIVNLALLDKRFAAGDTVSPKTLLDKKLIKARGGKTPAVKILGTGELTKKLSFLNVTLSASVKEKIEKSGGKSG